MNKFGFLQKRLSREFKTLVLPASNERPLLQNEVLNPSALKFSENVNNLYVGIDCEMS